MFIVVVDSDDLSQGSEVILFYKLSLMDSKTMNWCEEMEQTPSSHYFADAFKRMGGEWVQMSG